jgi:hypothetical protein
MFLYVCSLYTLVTNIHIISCCIYMSVIKFTLSYLSRRRGRQKNEEAGTRYFPTVNGNFVSLEQF